MSASSGANGTGGRGTVGRELLLDVLRGKRTRADAARQAGVTEAALDAARAALLAAKLPPASLSLSGIVQQPVRIVRDHSGTAHVYAETARDLFVGYGLAVAQDRLWQIDYYRRRALGRLAEILGPHAVASDRRNRLLGFGRLADQEVAALSGEAHKALDGFSAGINAWIEHVTAEPGCLPVEFEILEYAPEPWTPRDTLALTKAFFWQLTGRLENIAAGEAALRVLGPELAADFLTTEAPDETILPPSGAGTTSSAGNGRLVAAVAGGSDAAGGSNNWAIAPSRTTTGHAMLASDPHLPYMLPVGLYQVHLSGAGYDVAGAGYPGTPGVWFGHNDRVAWGLTNLVASPRDLYVETLDAPADGPTGPTRYQDGDGWATLDSRVETIAVKGAPDETLTVRSTARGPLVDAIVPLAPESGPNGEPTALSLRWTGHEVLGEIQAVLDLNRARDAASVRAALDHWRLPIFNFVYADVDGSIGWQATGSIPVRGDGDLTRGYRPANDPSHAWTGYIPFGELPRLVDPDRGWVGTANNRPVDVAEQTVPLYGWWAPGHRALRLRQIFDEGQQTFTADELRTMHADTTNLRAAEVVPALARLLGGTTAGARLLDLLAGWDLRMTTDSISPTVFEAFFERWHRRVLAARFEAETLRFLGSLGAGSGLAQRLLSAGQPAGWFGEGVSLAAIAEEAAAEALADLEARFGADPAGWRWGSVHQVSFRHPLDGRPGTDGLFATAPRETPGTGYVLNANGFSHDAPFDVVSGPEYRVVVDLGDLDATTTVLTTGVSGLPGSPHYDDMVDPWVRGAYLTLPHSPAAVEAAKTGETHLTP
ncbi:MAG: penicillin acylase family protein [Chloroflexota bacterium]